MTRNQRGVTIPEALVSVLLFMFIVAGLFSAIMAANKSWQTYGAQIRAQQEARKAVLRMTRDFRTAENIERTAGDGSLSVSFDAGSENVIYSWTDTGAQAHQLIRQTPNGNLIIAHNITSLDITSSGDLVTLDVTATVASSRAENGTFRLVHQVSKRL